MKALLSNYHQSPRKVRLVANLIRGKSVPQARAMLTFQPQKSSPALLKLLNSAVSNASGVDSEELFIKTVTVNKGPVLKRFKPMARGRAAQFHRTMSIVALELGTKQGTGNREQVVTKQAKKATAAKVSSKITSKKRTAKKIIPKT